MLVATDIVARGIDVDRISHVINYDLPSAAQDYVHRIGRTARAGASGTAISFLAAEQADELRDIEVHARANPCPARTWTASPTCSGSARSGAAAKKPKPRLVYNGSARRRSR